MNAFKIMLVFAFLFSSCDPGLKIKYEVVNKSDRPISIDYRFVFNRSGDTSTQTIIIRGKDSKIINEEDGLGYIDDTDKRRDSIYIYKLSIHQDKKTTKLNFKDKKYWKLKKNGEQEGIYQLIFDTTFFYK
jgi:hypothetical protein